MSGTFLHPVDSLFYSILLMSREQLADEQKLQMNMSIAGAHALCSLSESKPNKEAMRKYGLVPLIGRLLKSVHIDLIIPIMGTCQNCASEVICTFWLFLSLYIEFCNVYSMFIKLN